MKKIIITLSILLSMSIVTVLLFYIHFINLATYKWDTAKDIVSYGNKQYEVNSDETPLDLKLDKQIGKIDGEDSSFRICSIKGEEIDELIAIKGFMYPAVIYKRIK